ncbi:MAG: NADH:flavin oxidoreductase [Thermodesulfobacteriota bacterium]
MASIFEATTVNGMTLANRLVRSATWEGMCDPDGRPTARLADCYRDLARGSVGLIISGYTFVRPDGKQLPGKMGLHTGGFIGDLGRVVEAVHGEGGRLCIQLVHAGGQTRAQMAGSQPIAPSAVKVDQFPETPRAMGEDDIRQVVAAFGAAAGRAKEAGADAVQIHAAHGYLACQFLSPLTNRRTDAYGGSIDHRARFLLEVLAAIRQSVGPGFPVLVKLNGADFLPGGLELADAVAVAGLLDQAGIDAIEVSGGTPASGMMIPVRTDILEPGQEAYHLDLARAVKERVRCPVMVVGGFRSYDVVARAIEREGIDYVSLARPFIREPDLARRWQSGDHAPARCISCNGCFGPGLKEGGIACIQERQQGQKKG